MSQFFIDFYTVLYRKNCKNRFAQITEKNVRPKYLQIDILPSVSSSLYED